MRFLLSSMVLILTSVPVYGNNLAHEQVEDFISSLNLGASTLMLEGRNDSKRCTVTLFSNEDSHLTVAIRRYDPKANNSGKTMRPEFIELFVIDLNETDIENVSFKKESIEMSTTLESAVPSTGGLKLSYVDNSLREVEIYKTFAGYKRTQATCSVLQ